MARSFSMRGAACPLLLAYFALTWGTTHAFSTVSLGLRGAVGQRGAFTQRQPASFSTTPRTGSYFAGSSQQKAAQMLRMSSTDTKAQTTHLPASAVEGDFEGFHSVEFWVGNAKQAATYFCARFGFEPVAFRGLETGSRDVVTHVVQQGDIRFAFSSALNPGNEVMGAHHQKHGDGVRDVAFKVKDCRKVYEAAIAGGARSVAEPHEVSDEEGAAVMASIATYGDTIHTFVEAKGYTGCHLPGFRAVTESDPLSKITPSPRLAFIDHVVANQPEDEMESVCAWYTEMLGFERFWSVDDKQVTTEYSSLRSVVMTDPAQTVKLPINEPAPGKRKSQIQEFVDYYGGPGVQHIALRTLDILHSVQMLKDRGMKFLPVPDAYYDDLEQRLAAEGVEVRESLKEIRRLNILVDFDKDGYLLQIFMAPLMDRPTVFIEVIQRESHQGFGVGNFKALFEAIERQQDLRGNL